MGHVPLPHLPLTQHSQCCYQVHLTVAMFLSSDVCKEHIDCCLSLIVCGECVGPSICEDARFDNGTWSSHPQSKSSTFPTLS
eukprot:1394087-Prorocentrum_lima.AAC.1